MERGRGGHHHGTRTTPPRVHPRGRDGPSGGGRSLGRDDLRRLQGRRELGQDAAPPPLVLGDRPQRLPSPCARPATPHARPRPGDASALGLLDLGRHPHTHTRVADDPRTRRPRRAARHDHARRAGPPRAPGRQAALVAGHRAGHARRTQPPGSLTRREAALRKRFERLLVRLRALARQRGLLPP